MIDWIGIVLSAFVGLVCSFIGSLFGYKLARKATVRDTNPFVEAYLFHDGYAPRDVYSLVLAFEPRESSVLFNGIEIPHADALYKCCKDDDGNIYFDPAFPLLSFRFFCPSVQQKKGSTPCRYRLFVKASNLCCVDSVSLTAFDKDRSVRININVNVPENAMVNKQS